MGLRNRKPAPAWTSQDREEFLSLLDRDNPKPRRRRQGLTVVLRYAEDRVVRCQPNENIRVERLGIWTWNQIPYVKAGYKGRDAIYSRIRRTWGIIAPESFNRPVWHRRELRGFNDLFNPVYTYWVEFQPVQRKAHRLKAADWDSILPREGNPFNLQQLPGRWFGGKEITPRYEDLYWDGVEPTSKIKKALATQSQEMVITIPDDCVRMFRELTRGFKRPKATRGRPRLLFVEEAVRVLLHWRVPLCPQVVAELVKYGNDLEKAPSLKSVRNYLNAMGLEVIDMIEGFCIRLWGYAHAEAYIPKRLVDKYPHERTGHVGGGRTDAVWIDPKEIDLVALRLATEETEEENPLPISSFLLSRLFS